MVARKSTRQDARQKARQGTQKDVRQDTQQKAQQSTRQDTQQGTPQGGRFDAFYALEAEKQQRIIDAALTEFAKKGFKRASTNTIAANAQIGKGMLFYYFGNKEELFDFLCEYTIAFARDRYVTKFVFDTGDFLERCVRLTEIKRNAIAEYPLVISFFESFYREENSRYFAKHFTDIQELRARVTGGLFEGLDYTLFRDDIDKQAAFTYIKWLNSAYETDLTESLRHGELDLSDEAAMEAAWEHYFTFTDDLRKLFYKGTPP